MNAALVFLIGPLLVVEVSANELTRGRCYGWHMDIMCSNSGKIFPLVVMVGAKPKSNGCPEIMDLNANSTFERSCCTHDQESCYFPYSNIDASVTNSYFEKCIGRSNCTWPLARLDIRSFDQRICNSSIYPDYTTFMVLHYYCIEASEIQSISTSFSRNLVTTLHITAQNYSDNTPTGIAQLREPVSCSVEVSDCSGRVNITGLDVRLVKVGSVCKQTMTFLEAGTNSTIDCSYNSNFSTDVLYLSRTSYFIFVYNDSHGDRGGYIWLKFETVDKSHNMEIKCGDHPKLPKKSCNTVNGTAVNTMTSSVNREKPQSSLAKAISVSIVVIVILILACTVGITYLHKRRRDQLDRLRETLHKSNDRTPVQQGTMSTDRPPVQQGTVGKYVRPRKRRIKHENRKIRKTEHFEKDYDSDIEEEFKDRVFNTQSPSTAER